MYAGQVYLLDPNANGFLEQLKLIASVHNLLVLVVEYVGEVKITKSLIYVVHNSFD